MGRRPNSRRLVINTDRPTVSPELIAAIIESTPDRVRRRLDSNPDAAATWDWQVRDEGWSVGTGGETVTLPRGHVVAIEQLTCTCLLSPRCFHVLACLTRLQVAIVESPHAEEGERDEPATLDTAGDVVEPDEKQRHAARELVGSLAHLLRVGVANAGVVVQSGLLRAVHQCRADGLHRLAALGLRIIAGTSEFRARSPVSDPAQLGEDTADALETSRQLLSEKAVASFWVGTARRRQLPVRPRRLHGLLAEPIITRSGFSGAAVYFLGEDDRIYTASDVRLGDAQHARDAYLGGIEIGSMIQPAKQLARGSYLGTDLTASQDGRLGRGKAIKIVEEGQSTWQVAAIQARFQRSLLDQWNAVYAQAVSPVDARPAGWDFVFLKGSIFGAVGPELLFQPTTDAQPVRLAIENESESLYFRENLRMLSHAPGLRLQIIARLNLQEPRIASPLAISHAVPALGSPLPERDGERTSANHGEPRMELPGALGGRVCLGFDEIQRHFLINAQALPMVLNAQAMESERENPLGSLRRRWIATMLSGLGSQRPSNSNMLAAETATLNRMGFATGASLLDALSRPHSDRGPHSIDTFLATAIYLRTCSYELARSRATLES
jgi:hypothetical protein